MKEKFPIAGILKLLEKEDNFVFLENARCDEQNFRSYLFLRPEKIISTCKIDEIKNCFGQLDKALRQGYYIAGSLAYEAGEAFEERLRHRQTYDFPLLWFGVYKDALIYNHRQEGFERCSRKARVWIKRITLSRNYRQKIYVLKNIRANISQPAYLRAISKIKELIARGLTYQVNFTFKLKFAFSGSPCALYFNLRNNQSVSYAAFIKRGPLNILSFSPELFFRKRKNSISTRPMKGTAERGKDLEEDRQIGEQLKSSLKNRSENVMIVDLLRNDLGRISTTGSVRVPRLFNLEKYETLFQMTSDIQSRLRPADAAFDIFSHIFPSGSVTGAPKIKTMEIIRGLEKKPRNIYTGSIGFFSPDRCGAFNVAIRTLLINNRAETGEMGVGSGIVYDSRPRQEYAECRLKANFFIKKALNFALIETMLWQPDKGFLLLDEHLKRLENSAGYFGFFYKRKDILLALAAFKKHSQDKVYKVRLLLYKNGKIKLQSSLLSSLLSSKMKSPAPEEPRIYLSAKRTRSQNPFLYHKTTERKIYDQEYRNCRRTGFYDVIFTNEKDEITEGAISNIFVKKNGALFTPPIKCGLLDGVYRRYLFSSGIGKHQCDTTSKIAESYRRRRFSRRKYRVKEKVLFKRDLLDAQAIYLSNSVRGLVRVHLVV